MGPRVALHVLMLFVASVPLDVFPVASGASVSLVLGIVLVPAGVLGLVHRGYARRIGAAELGILAFCAWAIVSSFWAMDADLSTQRVVTYVQLFVFVFFVRQLVQGEEDALLLAAAFLVGAAAAAIASMLMPQEIADAEGIRYAAGGFDPNDLGVTLALGIPMAWTLASRVSGWRRIGVYSYIPLALVGTALTASRGATLAALASLLIVPLTLVRSRQRWKIFMAVGSVAVVALAYAVPQPTWERLLAIREEVARGTMTHRTAIWAAGWQAFSDNWLVGVGAGMFPLHMEMLINWRIVAHNTLLSVATELGVVGLVLFFVSPVVTAFRASERPRETRTFVWVLLVTWLVGASSLSWEYRKTTWFVFALALVLAIPAEARAPRQARTPASARSAR
jgi:O-antigen ligase